MYLEFHEMNFYRKNNRDEKQDKMALLPDIGFIQLRYNAKLRTPYMAPLACSFSSPHYLGDLILD